MAWAEPSWGGEGWWLGLGFRCEVDVERETHSPCAKPTMVHEFLFKEL